MSSAVFNVYSCYYDLLYRDKDYEGEAQYLRDVLARHGIIRGDLLEFGSGTGKHGCLLADMGYRVHGIERSSEMVARACSSQGFTCEQGDICTIDVGRQFDAVLSLFHVVSYQTANADVVSVFARAAEHIKPGGLFVFDFWYTPAVYAQRPAVRVKRLADEHIEVTRIAEPVLYPNENRVDVNYTIYARDKATGKMNVMQETHPMRHFSLPEIDLLCTMSKFERIEAEEFLTGKPVSEETWGACVILKKLNND
ncbi:MAG: class I SAM-dependent methyltransferase [Bacteroidales bacterium]|nr:class I SAM-dependent methyltransferase [Bacteroidales bacterium]